MSAWIVSKEHIDLIVSEGIRLEARRVYIGEDGAYEVERLTYDNADEVGRVLWSECQRSVAYRYPNDKDGKWPGPTGLTLDEINAYTWEAVSLKRPNTELGSDSARTWPNPERYHLAGLINAIECYEYQSCEHPEWRGSVAREWTESIYRRAVARLIRKIVPNLPWGIDAEHVARKAFSR